MSLPLVGMIAAATRTVVSVVAPEATARVYWGMPGVDELAVLPKRGATRGIRARARYLRQTRPDAAVVLPPSFSSAVGPWLAGVRVRVGYRSDGRGGLLTVAVDDRGAREAHLSEEYLRLGTVAMECVGVEPPAEHRPPAPTVSEEDRAEADRLLRASSAGGRYAVVVPGATYGPAKSWPWRRYLELAGALSGEITVVLAGTAAERDVCARIAEAADGVHNLAGQTSLGGFLSLLSRATVVVANDSGSPHLAASLGTPVVALFGSTSPRWTAPLGPSVEVIRHPVPCSPCFRKTCPTQLECFDGITVEAVLARARSYL